MWGVVEVGGGLGLEAEPVDVGLGGEPSGEDHLRGDRAVEAELPGFVERFTLAWRTNSATRSTFSDTLSLRDRGRPSTMAGRWQSGLAGRERWMSEQPRWA